MSAFESIAGPTSHDLAEIDARAKRENGGRNINHRLHSSLANLPPAALPLRSEICRVLMSAAVAVERPELSRCDSLVLAKYPAKIGMGLESCGKCDVQQGAGLSPRE